MWLAAMGMRRPEGRMMLSLGYCEGLNMGFQRCVNVRVDRKFIEDLQDLKREKW